MNKDDDEFDPNEVFGGDNEDLIDELDEEESKEDNEPFGQRKNTISSGVNDCIFERANENISDDDLEIDASKDLMNEMKQKMNESENKEKNRMEKTQI